MADFWPKAAKSVWDLYLFGHGYWGDLHFQDLRGISSHEPRNNDDMQMVRWRETGPEVC